MTDTGNAVGSQNFETEFSAYDDDAIDDFRCNATGTVAIDRVTVWGQVTIDQPTSFNVFIYNWTAGGPQGAPLCPRYNLRATVTPAPPGQFRYTIAGLSPNPAYSCNLTGGNTYWLEVQANLDFNPGGQWYWEMLQPVSSEPALWQNPGGGLGSCLTWGSIGDCVTFDGLGYDLAFAI